MNAPRVDIGLIVYNGEKHLAQSLESLLAQDYPNLHILVSDNASTDGTATLVERYLGDPRVRYVRQEKNLGAAGNYRFVVDQAEGPYFMAASHDDIWVPTYVSRCVAELERSPDAVLATSDVQFMNEEGVPREDRCRPVETRGQDAVHRLWTWTDSLVCTLMYGVMRLEALRRTRITTARYGADVILFTELATLGAFAWVEEPLFRFRVPPTFGKTTAQYLEDIDPNCAWDPGLKPFSGLVADVGEAIALGPQDDATVARALAGVAERFGLHHAHLRAGFLEDHGSRFRDDRSPQAFLRHVLDQLQQGARRVRPALRLPLEGTEEGVRWGEPRRLLWVAPEGLRGLLQVFSLAEGARLRWPDLHQVLLCASAQASLAESCAALDGLIPYGPEVDEPGKAREALLSKIGEAAFDLLVYPGLAREPGPDLLALAAPVPLRVAFDAPKALQAPLREAGTQLYAVLLPPGEAGEPESDRLVQAFDALGWSPVVGAPKLTIPDTVDELLLEAGWKGGPLLAWSPGSADRIQRYPAWPEALRASGLLGEATLVALGTAAESGEAERVLAEVGGGLNLCGRTDLHQAAGLLRRTRLLGASEGGLVHLACAVGTPQVVASGGAYFARRLPYAGTTALALHPLTCFGCGGACPFPDVLCLKDLAPALVGQALRTCWEEAAEGRPRLFAQPPQIGDPLALDLGPLLAADRVDYRCR